MTKATDLSTQPRWKPFMAALALCAAAPSGFAQSAPDTPEAREFDAALVEYERNHWQQAFETLARLAEQGHPDAMRIAAMMRRYGPALYGRDFSAAAPPVAMRAQR